MEKLYLNQLLITMETKPLILIVREGLILLIKLFNVIVVVVNDNNQLWNWSNINIFDYPWIFGMENISDFKMATSYYGD